MDAEITTHKIETNRRSYIAGGPNLDETALTEEAVRRKMEQLARLHRSLRREDDDVRRANVRADRGVPPAPGEVRSSEREHHMVRCAA